MAVDEKDLDPELREDAIKQAAAKNKVWEEELSLIREVQIEEQRLFSARLGKDRMKAYRLAQQELVEFEKKLKAHDKETERLEEEFEQKKKLWHAESAERKREEKRHKEKMKERDGARDKIEDLADTTVKQARKMKDALEGAEKKLRDIETAAGNATEGMLGLNSGLKGTMKGLLSTKGGFKAFGTGILRALNPVNLLLSLFTKVIEASIAVGVAHDDAAKGFMKATGATLGQTKALKDIAWQLNTTSVSAQEVAQAYGDLYTTATGFTDASLAQQKALTKTSALMSELGVSSQVTADIVHEATKSLGYGFGETEEVLREVAGVAASLNRPFNVVAKDFATVSKKLAFYGKNVMGTFKKLSAQAKSTGLSVDSLLGVVEQFDTFEGAGRAVGKLNAIMGGPYLNSIDMLNASEDERVEILKRSMKQSGMNFKQMGKYEQKMVASSLGVGVDEARKLFGAETEQQKMEALKKGELESRARKTMTMRESMDAFIRSFASKTLVNMLQEIIDAIKGATEWVRKMMVKFDALSTGGKAVAVGGLAAGAVGLKMAGGAAKRGIQRRLPTWMGGTPAGSAPGPAPGAGPKPMRKGWMKSPKTGRAIKVGGPTYKKLGLGPKARLARAGKAVASSPVGTAGKAVGRGAATAGKAVGKGAAKAGKVAVSGIQAVGPAAAKAGGTIGRVLGSMVKFLGPVLKVLGPIGLAITVIMGAIGPLMDKFKRLTKIFDMFKSGDIMGGIKELMWEAFDTLALLIPRILLNIVDQTVNAITGIINWLFGTKIGKLNLSGMFDKYIVAPLKAAFGWLFDKVVPAVKVVFGGIVSLAKLWWKGMKLIFDAIKTAALFVFDAIKTAALFVFKMVSAVFKVWWGVVKWVFDKVKTVALFVFDIWLKSVKFVFKVVTGIFKAWWKATKWVFGMFKKVAVGAFKIWLKSVKFVFSAIGAGFKLLWKGIKAVFSAIGAGFKLLWKGVKAVFTKAGEVIKNIWGGIKDAALAIWTPIKDGLTAAVDWVKEKAGAAMAWLKDKVQFWKGLGAKAKGAAGKLVSRFVDGMKEQWEKLKDKIPAPLRSAGAKLGAAGKWVGGKLGIGKGADDFVYQDGSNGRGKVTPINKKDVIMGSKRGGAVDSILKRMADASPMMQMGKLVKSMIQDGQRPAPATGGNDKPIIINVHVGQKKIDQIVIDALNSPTGKKYLSPYANH